MSDLSLRPLRPFGPPPPQAGEDLKLPPPILPRATGEGDHEVVEGALQR